MKNVPLGRLEASVQHALKSGIGEINRLLISDYFVWNRKKKIRFDCDETVIIWGEEFLGERRRRIGSCEWRKSIN